MADGDTVAAEPSRVLLESLAPPDADWGNLAKTHFERSAALDPTGARLTTSPEDADLILFCPILLTGRSLAKAIRDHDLRDLYPEKTFVFTMDDVPWATEPGVYPSIRRSAYVPWRHRSGSFFVHHHTLGATEFLAPSDVEPTDEKALFSFVGTAVNHPVRRRVLALSDPRACLVDTSASIDRFQYGTDAEREEGWRLFGESLHDSVFVLCPGGRGPSSMRIFEAMMAGRIPVVIADEWVPPTGPAWETFSLHVAERDVEGIPQLLRTREPDAPMMGRAAREAWVQFFSPERMLRTVVRSCFEIQAARPLPERWLRYVDRPRVIGVPELRTVARELRQAVHQSSPST
jgi:hypothetical protein